MKDESRPPLQFGLRTLFGITAACCVLFATLRWLEVPPAANYVVLAVLGVGALAAVGLVAAIASSVTGKEDEANDE